MEAGPPLLGEQELTRLQVPLRSADLRVRVLRHWARAVVSIDYAGYSRIKNSSINMFFQQILFFFSFNHVHFVMDLSGITCNNKVEWTFWCSLKAAV